MRPLIKICGNKTIESVLNIKPLRPDWFGFIFYKPSPRYIESSLDDLRALNVIKVGVFVSESVNIIREIVRRAKLNYVQLHGEESAETCQKIASFVPVIKAWGIDTTFTFDKLKPYTSCVDYFLFDTKTPSFGGSGRTFDWSILKNYTYATPFFLSGGIGREEASQLFKHPMEKLIGIDLNSKFEREKGIKDNKRIQQLLRQLL